MNIPPFESKTQRGRKKAFCPGVAGFRADLGRASALFLGYFNAGSPSKLQMLNLALGLGCKRSRVQIPAARPNSSKTYSYRTMGNPVSGVQTESKFGTPALGFRASGKENTRSRGRFPAPRNFILIRLLTIHTLLRITRVARLEDRRRPDIDVELGHL